MGAVRRTFGGDIFNRVAVGMVLAGLTLAVIFVANSRLPIIGAMWLIVTGELLNVSGYRNLLPEWLRQALGNPGQPGNSRRALPMWVMCCAGLFTVVLILGCSWQWSLVLAVNVVATDVCALVVGRVAKAISGGRTHRFTVHSPNKTWEGVVGGVVGSFVFTVSTAKIIGLEFPAWLYALFVVGSIIAVWGDLFESRLKREVDIKDLGRIFGAHGGASDRLDSIGPFFATVGATVYVLISFGALV